MKTYDKYKSSDIDWIGDIPEHWKSKRLKFVAAIQSSNVDKKSFPDEIPILLCNYVDVYKNDFIDDRISFMEATATEKEIEKFILNESDVLITKDSETPDDIANPALVRKDFENVICGYHLAQIRADKIELLGEYLFRLFQSKRFNSYFEVSANGITRFGLSLDSITGVFVSLPPLDEQTAIAIYLDEKTQQIDLLINNKLQLIELLKEERTAIINQTITRGINQTAKLKPSGIAWLGDIPEHWILTKFAFFAPIITCGLASTPEYVDDGIPFLSAQNVKNNKLNLNKYRFIPLELHQQLTKNKQPKKGDILVTRVGAGIGDACIVDVDFEFSIYVSLTHIRVDPDVAYNKFIMYFFSTDYCNVLNQAGTVTGGGVGNLNVNNVRIYKIPLPSIEEQKQIVEFIENTTSKIDATIAKIEKEIGFLNEYRTALIAEAVTGKIKVI